MILIEIILISIGLSLDVYAVVVLEGAMLAKIEKKKLVILCALFSLWQLVALITGNLLTMIPVFSRASRGMQNIWNFLSVVIFFALGAYMLYKAWRREVIFEHRQEISIKKACIAAMITSLDAFFAGIGFGLLETEMLLEGIVMLIVTILAVILGLYTGYRLGCGQKKAANWVSGAILIIAGIDVIVRYLT